MQERLISCDKENVGYGRHGTHCSKCSAKLGNYFCTREKNHEGKHHAHNLANICLWVWENGNE